MTQPDNTTPAASGDHLGEMTAAAAIALLLLHADQAEHLEHRAAAAAARPVRTAAVDVSRWVAQQWTTRYGSLAATVDPLAWSAFVPDIAQRLRADIPDPAPTVIEYAQRALDLGGRQTSFGLGGLRHPEPFTLDPATVRAAESTTKTVTARYDTAEQLLTTTPVVGHDDVTVALAPIHKAADDVDRDTRTLVNTALNQAPQDVAAHLGEDLIWISERDACVVCLALSGTVVGHTESFPADATFGDKPIDWWTPPESDTLLRPPRHPRCRCRCEVWLGHAGPPGSTSLPDALKREAQRSILRGFSLPSESERVRVRAADRLLKRGTTLPKTVQQVGRDAVHRGHFLTRTTPSPRG